MKQLMLATAAAGLTLPAASAFADPPPWAPAHGYRDRHVYDSHGRYIHPRPLTRRDRIWRGRDGRYYCHRDNGTTGLVIGAALGGLLGNRIAGHDDRTLGTILGAVGGGLLGRAIDRGDLKCR